MKTVARSTRTRIASLAIAASIAVAAATGIAGVTAATPDAAHVALEIEGPIPPIPPPNI